VVGSANFDVRSFDQNFEINAFIYGKHTADKFLNMFENDLLFCSEIKLDEWQHRSWRTKFSESAARLLSNLM
ncbi:MAG: phospholipase D-like domain-containing protein, partial [Paludibacter sp.]|nr:phospholipase D-like domain-containing protein [Paludibacter sp.]